MSPSDDDLYEMSGVDKIGAAGNVSGGPVPGETAAVTRFLTELRALGEAPAPTPTPELAALLDGAVQLALVRRHVRRALVRVALVAAAIIVAMTVAAANHSLPQPAQRMVSNVVNELTPFHIDPALPATGPVPPPPPTHRPAPSPKPPTSPVAPRTSPRKSVGVPAPGPVGGDRSAGGRDGSPGGVDDSSGGVDGSSGGVDRAPADLPSLPGRDDSSPSAPRESDHPGAGDD
jgi:type IV secretory pathway VirB10-like protein